MKKIKEVQYDHLEQGRTFIFTNDQELFVKASAGHIDSDFDYFEGDHYINDSVIPIYKARMNFNYRNGGNK